MTHVYFEYNNHKVYLHKVGDEYLFSNEIMHAELFDNIKGKPIKLYEVDEEVILDSKLAFSKELRVIVMINRRVLSHNIKELKLYSRGIGIELVLFLLPLLYSSLIGCLLLLIYINRSYISRCR